MWSLRNIVSEPASCPVFQVVVFQAYKNNSTAPIEAKYVFPLDDMAAGGFVIHYLHVRVVAGSWFVYQGIFTCKIFI